MSDRSFLHSFQHQHLFEIVLICLHYAVCRGIANLTRQNIKSILAIPILWLCWARWEPHRRILLARISCGWLRNTSTPKLDPRSSVQKFDLSTAVILNLLRLWEEPLCLARARQPRVSQPLLHRVLQFSTRPAHCGTPVSCQMTMVWSSHQDSLRMKVIKARLGKNISIATAMQSRHYTTPENRQTTNLNTSIHASVRNGEALSPPYPYSEPPLTSPRRN